MAPGIPLVAAANRLLPAIVAFPAMENAVATTNFGCGCNTISREGATCECAGGERGTAEGNGDSNNNRDLTQHGLSFIRGTSIIYEAACETAALVMKL